MKNCPNLQKSLDWCEGTPQYPGIRRRLYYINKNLIELWPTLERDEFGRIIDAHYMGAFTIAADAAWQYIDINIDKSTVTSEPQGEVPSQTQLNKATFVHNGIDAEATAAAGYLNNADCVFVYEDMIGHFRVLGNNKWRTKIMVNQDQGQGTNPASTTISVEVTDMIAPPFYVEGLETEDGEVFPSYDDDALLEPRLTSPSGTSFDIGTIADSGSSVSKTMHIKGVNLTEPLTISKTGTGLTISKSSITVEEANAGIDITLTYTKSTSGASSLNGSLRIYSATEVDKTIAVTARKAALTSPSASSIDVGTIASDGSSVQTSVTIQGANLSKAVSLRVTGNGFSLSKSSLSASQVNNGTAVIVYYNNSSQGPASATGSLVISSDEVNKTIELTAAKAAPSASPVLTSPTINSLDLGTIASDDTSVSKSITVRGENITQPVSIEVSGTGFSANKSTLTAAQVLAGYGVQLTYTNTASGAASATGSIRIRSTEGIDKTITLTAAKAAPSDTLNDYAHMDDLLLHLDGFEKGETADAWTDLIDNLVFPNHGATAEEKGWDLDGQNDWLGYDATSYNLPFSMENCTIEVCFYDKAINQGTGVPGSTAFLCSFGSQSAAGTNQSNGAYVNLCDSSNSKYINGCYLNGGINVYADPLIDAVSANTLSINKNNALHNGQALSSLGTNHWANVKGGRLIGVQNHGTNGKQNYFNGKIYAIRVYNRILTPAEMLHNQRVDNERFGLGLTLPEEEDDSVNVLKFLHISDVHNSADAINECKSMMDNDSSLAFTILTGDFSSGSSNSGASGYSAVSTPLTNVGNKLLMVNGNHDVWDAFLQSQQNATTWLKGKVTNNDVVWGDSQGVASYWYRDFEITQTSKLRIIGVDAYEYAAAQASRYDTIYSQTQVDWIVARMMELRATDYLIFAMHEPPVNSTVTDYAYNVEGKMDDDIVAKRRSNKFCSARLWVWDTSLSNGILLPLLVKAYKNKERMGMSLLQKNSESRQNVLALSLGYDFSEVNPATFLCYIGGHLHGEYCDYHPDSLYNDQLLLFVDNSNPSTLGSSSDIGTRSSDTASGTRSNGKLINEIALDFENRTIVIRRYGQQNALSYNGFAAVTRDTISFPFVKLAVNPVNK